MRLNPPIETAAKNSGQISSPSRDTVESETSTVASPDRDVLAAKPAAASSEDSELQQANIKPLSPTEARRAQRAIRRRAMAAAPKSDDPDPLINPMWIGFGGVMIIALIAWMIWSFVNQEETPATDSPDADSEEETSDEVEGEAMMPLPKRPEIFLARFQLPASQTQTNSLGSDEAKIGQARQAAATARSLKTTLLPFLEKYCSGCHGPDSAEAGIDISKLKSAKSLFAERKAWERIYRIFNAGAMPPPDHEPQPDAEERQSIVDLLHSELYEFDCDLIDNPGRPTVQRLNRSEYNNTIRDLFGLAIRPADKFPADDVGEGFDNVGDVLSVPPLLMEKYLEAAEAVANAVVDVRDFSKPQIIDPEEGKLYSSLRKKDEIQGFLILPTNGEVIGKFDVPASGEYEIQIEVAADQAGDEKPRLAIKVDASTVAEREVQEHRKPEEFQHRQQLKAGKQRVSVAFLNDATFKDGPKDRRDRNLGVRTIQLYGPIGGGVPVRSDIHRRFVIKEPSEKVTVKQAANAVLRPVLLKAFRRDVSASEVSRYSELVSSAVNEMGESYESALSLALQAILVSPDFLFRIEKDPPPDKKDRHLDEFEVASRLSYFLWSSMPDDELLTAAHQKKLLDPTILRTQIQRMLKDEKSEALVTNFAGQWLNLRNLEEVTPDPEKFKSFDSALRNDMRRETELLFETVMKEDRSVEQLLSADFTFLNKRLAKHYEIKGIKSEKFERVSLKGTNRSGVLTHASILTLTSNPGRTSPVKRGKWIMENIFGESPPPPPPNVPELEETAKTAPNASLREQLEKHREDPGCASCHRVMDPLGLGLENFDPIGRWREKDGDKKIDSSGSLPSGEKFSGSLQLIKIIQKRREKYFRTLTGKMLTYAVGRGTHYYDKCAVDDCLVLMKTRGYRFSALVEGIVLSDPFLKRRGPEKSVVSN